ncbi:hypothetical protein JY96_21160 [Aquabacterium sp. NJ1]|uniref:hypothetical protein n=1 Tax=Aquabacterium sp. NJ1 TaxID=1538295 RepID=UPI00052D0F0C|nr:hypothetical protein [Aquabacterium sp. NJ1]KGM38689.1 hypothetical protein JY96_21160 [Aquabacterium sp. NJ1]
MSNASGAGGDHKTSLQVAFESELHYDGDEVVRVLSVTLSPVDLQKLYGMLFAVRAAAEHGANVISAWFMPFKAIQVSQDGILTSIETVHVNVFPEGEVCFEVELPEGGPRCEAVRSLSLDEQLEA